MKVSAFVLLHKKHSIESVSGNNYRMMKRALLYIVILMCFTTSSAQIIETGESNPVWGVRAAFDVNLPGKIHGNVIDDRMFRNGTGVTVGTSAIGSTAILPITATLVPPIFCFNSVERPPDFSIITIICSKIRRSTLNLMHTFVCKCPSRSLLRPLKCTQKVCRPSHSDILNLQR